MKHKLLILLLVLSNNVFGQHNSKKTCIEILNLDTLYQPYSGTFVLIDLKKEHHYWIYNDSISKKRFSPCSTFKITNSLISLDAGIAADKNYVIKYDSVRNPSNPWWSTTEPFKYWPQDHTMKSAIKYSVVWYYQELARRIGPENMKKLLKQINYGNNDMSSGIDQFWLCGSLEISAVEQVEFLKKLYNKQLKGFSKDNQETVKQIMLYEDNEDYKLYGKTGGGDCWDNKVIGWYVGFLETKTSNYVFAMNIFVSNFGNLANNKRIELTKEILKKLKLIN